MTGVDPVLLRGLTAIEPYLDDVVLAGGWVPYVYELLYDATAAGRSPKTRDIDIAVPRSVPVRGQSIDALLAEANFTCEFTSTTVPPVTKYLATDGDQAVEIEFITDAVGASETAIAVQPDLTAQELRYVGLLLQNPWVVDLGGVTGGTAGLSILVPEPAAFIFQKALSHRQRRDRLKAEKDLYYIFFVLEAFPKWRGMIDVGLSRFASTHRTWFRKCRERLGVLFAGADSSGVHAILNQRPATAFSGMTDEQFRQYVYSYMLEMLAVMDAAIEELPR